MRISLFSLFPLLLACSGKDEVTLDTDLATGDTDPTGTPGPSAPTCDLDLQSACGSQRSILRGSVRLGEGVAGRSRGDLFLALTHEAYDGSFGGGYHTHLVLPDVDLAGPVPFALDMCAGGTMWTEENCSYGLVVVLDKDGSQSSSNLLPDQGEPATRVPALRVSCDEDAPCLDIVLECTDGASCVTFTAPVSCDCEPSSCGSDFALCSY